MATLNGFFYLLKLHRDYLLNPSKYPGYIKFPFPPFCYYDLLMAVKQLVDYDKYTGEGFVSKYTQMYLQYNDLDLDHKKYQPTYFSGRPRYPRRDLMTILKYFTKHVELESTTPQLQS